MEYTAILIEAIGTLTVNKLRTGLAILGIVIGIGSVIALISLGEATQKSVSSQIESLGANLLTVNPGAQRTGAVRGAAGGGTTLTLADANAIKTSLQVTAVQNVSPELARRTQITTGGNNTNTQVIGVTPVYATVHKLTIASGSFISQRDVDGMTKVAVVGPQVVSDLFSEGAMPIGQTIRINGQTFTIIGISESKGGTGFANQDDIVWVPLSTAQKQLLGVDYLSSIALEAKSSDLMTDAQNQVGYLLLSRHHLSDPAQADFSIFSQQDILNTVSSTTGMFTALLSGIAAISLLVGGIGIRNIMLVTVTERTREIGLRKALGAKNSDILNEFLIESVLVTVIGGIIGIIVGAGLSWLLYFIAISFGLTWSFTVPLYAIIIGVGVSGTIGITFGVLPARSAAKMDPIEALRYG